MTIVDAESARAPPSGYSSWDDGHDENGKLVIHNFEENAGPLWSNKTRKTCGMYCTKKNLNGGHVMHGGCLTTLADAALFTIGEDDLQPNKGWTSNLNMNFVAPVRLGEWVEARGKVTSSTKFLLFLTGELHVDERIVATFTGIVKKAGPRPRI